MIQRPQYGYGWVWDMEFFGVDWPLLPPIGFIVRIGMILCQNYHHRICSCIDTVHLLAAWLCGWKYPSVCGLWSTLWSGLKYLKNYGKRCHEIKNKHSWSQEDESGQSFLSSPQLCFVFSANEQKLAC